MSTTKTPLVQQIAFLNEIEKLKSVTRANRTLDGRNENSAEHSWHVALMALLLEEHARSQLDLLRVTRMLLIHDIVEIDAGDTWAFDENQDHKLTAETNAANRLFALLPDTQRDEFHGLWQEFENRSSEEARFATVIDGIQPLLNHLLTGRVADGVIAIDKVRSKKAYIKGYATNLWSMVEDLIQASASRGLYV